MTSLRFRSIQTVLIQSFTWSSAREAPVRWRELQSSSSTVVVVYDCGLIHFTFPAPAAVWLFSRFFFCQRKWGLVGYTCWLFLTSTVGIDHPVLTQTIQWRILVLHRVHVQNRQSAVVECTSEALSKFIVQYHPIFPHPLDPNKKAQVVVDYIVWAFCRFK